MVWLFIGCGWLLRVCILCGIGEFCVLVLVWFDVVMVDIGVLVWVEFRCASDVEKL